MGKACKAVSIARQTAYEWRSEIPEFAEAWDRAMKVGVSALEDEAHRRAFDGIDKPIVHQGVVMSTCKEYSDTLAIFLLKAHAPDKYRERISTEISNPDGSLTLTPDERAAKLAALVEAAKQRKDLV